MFHKYEEIFLDNGYEVKNLLGEGGFGIVLLLYDIYDKVYCVGKIINISNIVGTLTFRKRQNYYQTKYDRYKDRKECIQNEGGILACLKNSKYCVKILDFIEDIPAIVMEYCEGGNINEVLQDMTNKDKLAAIYQILLGIEFCHKKNIIHGDLKPQNILLKYKYIPNKINENLIKISDFGLSVRRDNNENKLFGGTRGYRAPEVRENGTGGSFPSDIYSIGKMFYEILTNCSSEKVIKIKYINFDNNNKKIKRCLNSNYFIEQLKKCLHPIPNLRPNITSLREDFEEIYCEYV